MNLCAFPRYGSITERCGEEVVEILEVDIEGSVFGIPMCKHHADTWEILIGYEGLARLIRDNKLCSPESEENK